MDADQFATLVGLLVEIRDLLRPPEEEANEGEPVCEHPEDRQIDLSTPRETHWICQDCGYVEQRGTLIHAPAFSGADAKE